MLITRLSIASHVVIILIISLSFQPNLHHVLVGVVSLPLIYVFNGHIMEGPLKQTIQIYLLPPINVFLLICSICVIAFKVTRTFKKEGEKSIGV